MPSECLQRLAISRNVAGAIDTFCSLQRHDSQNTNDTRLALKNVRSVLAQSRAELLEAECALHDHIREHGCWIERSRCQGDLARYPVG